MFRYFLAFLLLNTCYQSLGNPIQPPKQLISKSLAILAAQCKNPVLSKHLVAHLTDCAVSVPPYSKKQFQCLIFYDINMQLCSAVASSNLTINDDSFVKVDEKQDVNAVCTLAKQWVFTNMTNFVNYKESAEKFIKLPATCGEVCGVEEAMNEANYYCKYYKLGLEMLKSQLVSTTANNVNNDTVAAPLISETDLSAKADVPVAINPSNPIKPQDPNTKILNDQIKLTEPAVAITTSQKNEVVVDNAVAKPESAVQATSKQSLNIDEAENAENADDSDVNVNGLEDPVVAAPESVIPQNTQVNKTSIAQAEKPAVANEAAAVVNEPGAVAIEAALPANSEQKPVDVLENPKPKAIGEAEDYGDSDGNDNPDEDNEDLGLEIKPDQDVANQNTIVRNKEVVPAAHEADVSQKEFFSNSMPDDGFSDEGNDHFFPFFMTSVVLMVLLYVLYHNKSKVSKVFFGLILEGRQSGRRRNSRGHSYRRLDTLEQAMSANTAAPPSKIIY